ncbi:MAG: hypothetical protein IPN72_25525 [Saprospiraceae bacterium]|nr:hypothetical protein [Saprospiraceae bacterium]
MTSYLLLIYIHKRNSLSLSFHSPCFVSPSGDGLKVFIEVNSGSENHALAYQQVKDHCDNLTGFVADENVRTLTGFVCHF